MRGVGRCGATLYLAWVIESDAECGGAGGQGGPGEASRVDRRESGGPARVVLGKMWPLGEAALVAL